MVKYLKSKQEYIDLYDIMTVKDCCRRENFHKKSKPSKGPSKDICNVFSKIALHFDILYTTIRWHEDKDKTINEWIDRDTRKDELYENANAPENIQCLTCKSITTVSSKMLYDFKTNQNDRVIFMYNCPKGCLPHRAFFDDGEEYVSKPRSCPKCDTFLIRESEHVTKKKIITTEKCPDCGHIETNVLELEIKKGKKKDANFEKDRERFCLSGERLTKNLEEKNRLEEMSKFMDDFKKKEKNKPLYDKIKSLEKLTVPQIKERFNKTLEKNSYTNIVFQSPEIGRIVSLGFTAEDSKNRPEYDSKQELTKSIKKMSKNTNWRLMSDGIFYRLGVLSGRLRAYELEEDLLKLVKQNKKRK